MGVPHDKEELLMATTFHNEVKGNSKEVKPLEEYI